MVTFPNKYSGRYGKSPNVVEFVRELKKGVCVFVVPSRGAQESRSCLMLCLHTTRARRTVDYLVW